MNIQKYTYNVIIASMGVIFLFKTPKYVSFVDKQETCSVAIRLTLLRNGCNAAKQVTFYVEKPKTPVTSCTRVNTLNAFDNLLLNYI